MAGILLAGFGGQGILFAGKQLTKAGMDAGKQVSWLPSYGPEMRGGTANCHVIISDEPVSCPMVSTPDILVAMNKPSLDKFEDKIAPGGMAVIDSTLIDRKLNRDDVKAFYIPATQIATDMDAPKLANMVIIGKIIKERNVLTLEEVTEAMKKLVPKSKPELAEINVKAILAGYNYKD